MRQLFISVFFLFAFADVALAQLPFEEKQLLARLKPGGTLPEKLLSTRSVVFYSLLLSQRELERAQETFQRTGIDATFYLEADVAACGRDVSVALAQYLNKRDITNLIFLQKGDFGYRIIVTSYNQRANLVEQDQPAFVNDAKAMDVLLQDLYRTAANTMRSENFLINDYPETGITINPIQGRRSEFFAIDLKVDELAVPKFGDPAMDQQLEEIMKSYPYKYKLTEPNIGEADLRKQGFLYVLRFVHCRNRLGKSMLGYDMTKGQSGLVSTAYITDVPTLKTIASTEPIYKFYFKHIESDNVFLGTKWDADETWQQALINQIRGFRAEFKIP